MAGPHAHGAAVAALRRLMADHNLDEADLLGIVAIVLQDGVSARKRGGPVKLHEWKPSEKDWDFAARLFAGSGRWSPQFGPDPDSPMCQCPPDILARHNITRRTVHAS